MPDEKKKKVEITRFRIADEMTVTKLRGVLEAFGVADSDTIRHYNGALIVERDAVE